MAASMAVLHMTMTILGLLMGLRSGGRQPRRENEQDNGQFSLPWLSTPKYPKGSDNGRDDEGYYVPIKKEHAMKNYEEAAKGRKK
jgi:hypothetical protein